MDEPFQGFFRTLPQMKKSAGLGPHSGREWTPPAYAESMAGADDESEAESEAEAEEEEGAATQPVWGCAYGDRCTFAHSWVELHPEASAHEQQLASYFPD